MHSRAVNATRLTFAMLEIGCSTHAIFSAYLAFFWNITGGIDFATTSLRFSLSICAFYMRFCKFGLAPSFLFFALRVLFFARSCLWAIVDTTTS